MVVRDLPDSPVVLTRPLWAWSQVRPWAYGIWSGDWDRFALSWFRRGHGEHLGLILGAGTCDFPWIKLTYIYSSHTYFNLYIHKDVEQESTQNVGSTNPWNGLCTEEKGDRELRTYSYHRLRDDDCIVTSYLMLQQPCIPHAAVLLNCVPKSALPVTFVT